jgi:hypothetical protein
VKAFKLPQFDDVTANTDAEELDAAAEEFVEDDLEVMYDLSGLIFDRASCAAHTLQLVVKHGLSVDTKVTALLQKVAKICGAVRKSLVDTETVFGAAQAHFVAMNVTRWNSQFRMLEQFLRITRTSPGILEQLQCRAAREQKLSAMELHHLEDIVDLLGAFNEATTILQSETSSGGALIPTLCALWHHLQASKTKPYLARVCATMISEMSSRFSHVVSDAKWLACAVLDPRFRMAFCKPIEGFMTLSALDIRKLVFSECKTAYREYNYDADDDGNNPGAAATTGASTSIRTPASSFLSAVLHTSTADMQSNPNDAMLLNQLNSYATAAVLRETADIFEYIREFAAKDYPRLIPAWRKFLCIPATSAPVECVFSTAGDIVTQDRCSLHSDVIEDLVFVKRNLRIMRRKRELQHQPSTSKSTGKRGATDS